MAREIGFGATSDSPSASVRRRRRNPAADFIALIVVAAGVAGIGALLGFGDVSSSSGGVSPPPGLVLFLVSAAALLTFAFMRRSRTIGGAGVERIDMSRPRRSAARMRGRARRSVAAATPGPASTTSDAAHNPSARRLGPWSRRGADGTTPARAHPTSLETAPTLPTVAPKMIWRVIVGLVLLATLPGWTVTVFATVAGALAHLQNGVSDQAIGMGIWAVITVIIWLLLVNASIWVVTGRTWRSGRQA